MIGYLRGRLLRATADQLVVDVGGVGYQVGVPLPARERLGPTGSEVELHVHTHVREDILALYGFPSVEELEFFRMLIEVDGVGPKVALAILGSAHLDLLKGAILADDPSLIRRAPGVGAKTAAKVIIDLKSRVEAEAALTPALRAAGPATNPMAAQVESGLRNLGFSQLEARQGLEAVDWSSEPSVEEALRTALRSLGR